MKRILLAPVDLVLFLVQGVVMLVLVVPLQRTSQLMNWCSWKIIKYVYYYGVVVPRRKLTGRPVWRDTDLMLGIQPPQSELARIHAQVQEAEDAAVS